MQHILIASALVLIMVLTDLVPLFKKKEKHALWFAIPSYTFSLVIGILVGSNVNIVSPLNLIINFIRSVLKIKM